MSEPQVPRPPYKDKKGQLRIPMRCAVTGHVFDVKDDGHDLHDSSTPLSERAKIIRGLSGTIESTTARNYFEPMYGKRRTFAAFIPVDAAIPSPGEGMTPIDVAHAEWWRVWNDDDEKALAANLALKAARLARHSAAPVHVVQTPEEIAASDAVIEAKEAKKKKRAPALV
jgi:hypothetical protein